MKILQAIFFILLTVVVISSQTTFKVQSWTAADPEFKQWRSFVLKVDQFDRKLGGCDLKAPPPYECHAGLGEFDAKLWSELRSQGKELFK